MALYEAGRKVAAGDGVMGAHRFLVKAREWALGEIEKREGRVRELGSGIEKEQEKEDEARKLGEWRVYLKFTEHALAELERGELDAWFKDGA